jgi:hypothetical protein
MKTRLLILFAFLLLSPSVFLAQEALTLTTPVTKPSLTVWHVARLTLDWDANTVIVQLKGNNGEDLAKSYDATTNPTGAVLMVGLNKANLTTRSLNQRIFDRLVADGVVVGAVTGTVP